MTVSERFYITDSSGNVQGPYEPRLIRKRLEAGEIDLNTQVCPEHDSTGRSWMPLSNVPEIAGGVGGPAIGFGGMVPPPPPPRAAGIAVALPKVGYVGPVLTTIFCCLIGGIVSLMYTGKANTAAAIGNAEEYQKAVRSRRGWLIASIIIGPLFGVLYGIAGEAGSP